MVGESLDLVVKSRRVVTPEGERALSIGARDGRIHALESYTAPLHAASVLDFGDQVVLPGLCDTHVHVNEPGRTEWEGFRTATRAAAAGGITTIVDMPLNSIPPTVDAPGLAAKRAATEGKLFVDVGLWGGVIPGNTGELAPLFREGLPGFKCFLVPSGVDEFPHVDERDLRQALPVIAELGAILLVHAEAPGPIEAAERRALAQNSDPRKYSTYLSTRPPEAEVEAIELLVRLARDTGARIHVVHFACADAIETLRSAKREKLQLSAETCPHYLYFRAEEIPDGATAYKCAPPIREERHATALREALRDGTIDYLVSDHSPCTPALKKLDTGSFLEAWGGIASLQLGLSIAWTMAKDRGVTFTEIARWMCETPARMAGLGGRKGAIAIGFDADLTVFDPDASFVVSGKNLAQRHPVTPYEGQLLAGSVQATFLRGRNIFQRGIIGDEPVGQLVRAGNGSIA
jgi:allantoinase